MTRFCPYCNERLSRVEGTDYHACPICGYSISDQDIWLKNTALCCACSKPVKGSKWINYLMQDKKATWEFPTWNNLLVQDLYPEMRASSLVCDNCVDNNTPAKFAIEINAKSKTIHYHPLNQLQSLPEMDKNILASRGAYS